MGLWPPRLPDNEYLLFKFALLTKGVIKYLIRKIELCDQLRSYQQLIVMEAVNNVRNRVALYIRQLGMNALAEMTHRY